MKKRKIVLVFTCLFVALCVNKIFKLLPRDYVNTYKMDGFTVKEEYIKDDGIYKFNLDNKDNSFVWYYYGKYDSKHMSVEEISTYQNGDYNCVLPKGDSIDTYPVCKNGENYISYTTIADENYGEFYKREASNYEAFTYGKVDVNYLKDITLAVWNSYGFNCMSTSNSESLKFLENEFYYDELSYMVDNYIVVPNYDMEHSFNKIYILDLEKFKVKSVDIDYDISYNAYYLGSHDGLIYLVDRKNRQEYAIDPAKERVKLITKDEIGTVWNGKWETISMIKLANNDYLFSDEEMFNFSIEDGNLYMSLKGSRVKSLVSSKEVDKIVKQDNDRVYFLVKDKLYLYDPLLGEVLVATYDEWNFNQNNPIYIY